MAVCYYCMKTIEDGARFCPECGRKQEERNPLHHLQPGTILNGRYTIGKSIGEGGFGITYAGIDNVLQMRVAIKEYYPSGIANRTQRGTVEGNTASLENGTYAAWKKKFLDEAINLGRFSDEPGIVNVRDFFEENNTAYMVMEYLDGETLKSRIDREGSLSVRETVNLFLPVMRSLENVHARELIHRDISPDNVYLTKTGAKLIDFGAARQMSSEFNKSISVMLKGGYSPEEQYRRNGVQGPWTDVYSLAATMYTCITGVVPDDAVERLLEDKLVRPSALGVSISDSMETAILKGMSVRSKDRFQTVREMIEALENSDWTSTDPGVNRTQKQEKYTINSTTAAWDAGETSAAWSTGTEAASAREEKKAFGSTQSAWDQEPGNYKSEAPQNQSHQQSSFQPRLFWMDRIIRLKPEASKLNGRNHVIQLAPHISPYIMAKMMKHVVKNTIPESQIIGIITLALDRKGAYVTDKFGMVLAEDRILFSTMMDSKYVSFGLIGVAAGAVHGKKVPREMTLFYEDVISAYAVKSILHLKLRDGSEPMVDLTSVYSAPALAGCLQEIADMGLWRQTNGPIRTVIGQQ